MKSPRAQATHYVYRCFDAYGALLYVGCTVNVKKRMQEHRRGSEWGPACTRIETTTYPDRATARTAESEAIRSEQPVWNIQWSGRPLWMFRPLDAWLARIDAEIDDLRAYAAALPTVRAAS